MLIISQSITIIPYGHETYQLIATDKFNPVQVAIAVDRSELRQLKKEIETILGE